MAPSFFRRQPAKGLYLTVSFFTLLFVRLPFWALRYLPAAARPRRSWSLKRTILVRIIRRLTGIAVVTGNISGSTPSHKAIKEGPNVNAVWIDPVPEQLIVGKLKEFAKISDVKPVRVPGYWILKKSDIPAMTIVTPVLPDEKVILNLHGGAYTRLSAHPDDPTANVPKGLVSKIAQVHRSLSVEYRLSVGPPNKPENPFPTALLDALAAYCYLTHTLKIPPGQIIITGDSAGGNLTLALVRYLVEHQKNAEGATLPALPSGIILLSPWSDLGSSHIFPGGTAFTCGPSDYLGVPGWARYAKAAFAGPYGLGGLDINPYMSPASRHPQVDGGISFKGFPRTFIVCGGAELLADEIRTLKSRMTEQLGEDKVEYYEAPDGVHDYLVFPWHEPERSSTLKTIARWVENTA